MTQGFPSCFWVFPHRCVPVCSSTFWSRPGQSAAQGQFASRWLSLCGPRRSIVNWESNVNTCIYYTALQNVPKSSVDLNGPSQRLQFLDIHHLEKLISAVIGNGFCVSNSHLSYHSARSPSFNVAESHCNLKSASKELLRNTWDVKSSISLKNIFFLAEITKLQQKNVCVCVCVCLCVCVCVCVSVCVCLCLCIS